MRTRRPAAGVPLSGEPSPAASKAPADLPPVQATNARSVRGPRFGRSESVAPVMAPGASHLWDGWIVHDEAEGVFHRFILSAPGTAGLVGSASEMAERDRLAFIRHFSSRTGGRWRDHGHTGIEGWSGNALVHNDALYLYFTAKGKDQKLCLAIDQGDGCGLKVLPRPLLDPKAPRLRRQAERLGYHLGDGDGYFPAWRDPYPRKEGDVLRLYWAAKAETPSGIVPAVGRAESKDGHDWTLCAPMTVPGVAGQIELPILIEHNGVDHLFYSHTAYRSDAPDEAPTPHRSCQAARWHEGKWRPLGSVTDAPVYGLNLVADPAHPGAWLAHAFYNEGPDAMSPTAVVPLHWDEDGRPSATFTGAFRTEAATDPAPSGGA